MANHLKYKSQEHPQLLIDLFSNGHDVARFCAEADISDETFFQWVHKYPEFGEAYSIARSKAKAFLEGIALDALSGKQDINTTLWSIIMRNRFGYTEHRKLKLPKLAEAKNLSDMAHTIANELADGAITANEATQVVGMVADIARIEENMTLKREVSEIKELLRANVAAK